MELFTTVILFADDEVLRFFSIKGEYIKTISILKHDFLTKPILDQAKNLINQVPPLELSKDMKEICGKIVDFCIDRKYVNENYVQCVRRFYETGEECEYVVLSGLRENSFIVKILTKTFEILMNNDTPCRIIAVTVGVDHVDSISKVLEEIGIQTVSVKIP